MVDSYLLFKLDSRHVLRQQKKDSLWAVPERVYCEPTREDLKLERDRVYLEENFPDDEFVRVDDL